MGLLKRTPRKAPPKRLRLAHVLWIIFAVLVLVLAAVPVFAESVKVNTVTFCDVCAGYTISKRGDDVLIRCPDGSIWLTVKDCKNPSAKRTATKVTLTCQFQK